MDQQQHADLSLAGEVLRRDDPGYEQARQDAVWNARKPDRYPDVIVRVSSEQDVAEAVRYANSHAMKIAIRSGGHSLAGAALRNGGMLLDLSALDRVVVDADAMTATVEPAATSSAVAAELGRHGLAFPVGHCGSVGMGGYLLSGGFGWNMGSWGPACLSVTRVDVVDASGMSVAADESSHPDLLWAARGAGSGFPAVATRFQLRVNPLPGSIRRSMVLAPISDIDALCRWAVDAAATAPRPVEMFLVLASDPAGSRAAVCGVGAVAFADTDDEASRMLSFVGDCPVHAVASMLDEPATFETLHGLIGSFLPAGKRFAEDSVWSSESVAVLLPQLAERVVRAPSSGSHILAPMVRPSPGPAPDAALSMFGRSLVLAYAVWDEAAEDARNERWLRETVRSIARFTTGHYIAENDLLAGPDRARKSFGAAQWDRLGTVTQQVDPDHRFFSYLSDE